ncbi:MAG: hypothetical protein JHC24_00050 [Thaumarchaeota archaeon]|nr:hypothetical protein [Nitrososphaerota archaeon]
MRSATVAGFLSTEEDVAAELSSSGLSGLGNAAAVAKVVAVSATKLAWRYVPALARSLVAATYVATRYERDGMRLWVMAKSESEEEAGAYAAFGALAGLLAAWNTVKGCSKSCRASAGRRCTTGNVHGISELRRVDAPWEQIEEMDNSTGPPHVGFFDVSEEPLYEGIALAEGSIVGLELAEEVAREAEELAREAAPRAWEVLPLVHMNNVLSVSAKATPGRGSLDLTVEVKSRARTGSAMEAAFGAGVALIYAWAAGGGHPEIRRVAVPRSVKVPLESDRGHWSAGRRHAGASGRHRESSWSD